MSAAGWCDHHPQQISESDSTPIRNDLPVPIRLFGLAIFNGQSEQGRIGPGKAVPFPSRVGMTPPRLASLLVQQTEFVTV